MSRGVQVAPGELRPHRARDADRLDIGPSGFGVVLAWPAAWSSARPRLNVGSSPLGNDVGTVLAATVTRTVSPWVQHQPRDLTQGPALRSAAVRQAPPRRTAPLSARSAGPVR